MILIYKSERKQAKFQFQLHEYKKDLVKKSFTSADPANNFKLLCGSGEVNAFEPLIDDLFALKVKNAVRLRRTVEILDNVPAKDKSKKEE